jgi:hypothetical protein
VFSTQGAMVRPPMDQHYPVWRATVTTSPLVPRRIPPPSSRAGQVMRKQPARIAGYCIRPRVPLPPMSGHVPQIILYRRR